MSKFSSDSFERAKSNAWTASDGATWGMTSSGTTSLYQPGDQEETGEMCPICVLLLDEEGLEGEDLAQGTALFAKYMRARIQMTFDGKGNVTEREDWHCSMCGASGEGSIPYFHAKPKKEETNES